MSLERLEGILSGSCMLFLNGDRKRFEGWECSSSRNVRSKASIHSLKLDSPFENDARPITRQAE